MTEEYTQNQENLIPVKDKPNDESESIDTNHDLLNRSVHLLQIYKYT